MQTGEDRVAVVESGGDENLNKNTTACFVKATSHLSNSSKVEKSMFWPWRRHVVSCLFCLVCSLGEHRGHEQWRIQGGGQIRPWPPIEIRDRKSNGSILILAPLYRCRLRIWPPLRKNTIYKARKKVDD